MSWRRITVALGLFMTLFLCIKMNGIRRRMFCSHKDPELDGWSWCESRAALSPLLQDWGYGPPAHMQDQWSMPFSLCRWRALGSGQSRRRGGTQVGGRGWSPDELFALDLGWFFTRDCVVTYQLGDPGNISEAGRASLTIN